MQTIGTRELKSQLGRVLREVHERQEVYAVTRRGRIVARLIPESASGTKTLDFDTSWSEMDRLADELAQEWPEGVSAEETVDDR